MNHIAYLKRIRFLHGFLLLCAVILTAFGSLMGGVGALILSFAVIWIYHRCPKCSSEVDTLLPLNKESCCPTCGFYLKDGTEPEEMRLAREQAEEEAKAKAEAEAAEKAAAEAEAAEKAALEAELGPEAEAETVETVETVEAEARSGAA